MPCLTCDKKNSCPFYLHDDDKAQAKCIEEAYRELGRELQEVRNALEVEK